MKLNLSPFGSMNFFVEVASPIRWSIGSSHIFVEIFFMFSTLWNIPTIICASTWIDILEKVATTLFIFITYFKNITCNIWSFFLECVITLIKTLGWPLSVHARKLFSLILTVIHYKLKILQDLHTNYVSWCLNLYFKYL